MPVELFVADINEQRLKNSGLPDSHRSIDAYAFFPHVDGAIIVTPAQTHFDLCRELLELRKDVFVEKPITLLSVEARRLAEIAECTQCILQVGHIFRFDSASLWLRDEIRQGRLGRLKILRGRFSGFKRPRPDTGVTFADAIHFIDLFNFFLGKAPHRVHAIVKDFMGRGMDDESLVALEYGTTDGPVLAIVEAGYHIPGKAREVTVVGEKSSVVCDYNVAQYKIRTFENRHLAEAGSFEAVEGEVHQLEFPPEEPLRTELTAFIESLETREPSLADGRSGFEAVRVVEAALESARAGRWIEIAE